MAEALTAVDGKDDRAPTPAESIADYLCTQLAILLPSNPDEVDRVRLDLLIALTKLDPAVTAEAMDSLLDLTQPIADDFDICHDCDPDYCRDCGEHYDQWHLRSVSDILAAEAELVDRLWYGRKPHRDAPDPENWAPDIVKEMRNQQRELEARYGTEVLDRDVETDWAWGLLSGKVPAIRWILGFEWDCLDT